MQLTGDEIRRLLLISAALGVPVQILIRFHGLDHTTVSHASLMVGSMPVLLAAAAAFKEGERLDWIGWVALVGSTSGRGSDCAWWAPPASHTWRADTFWRSAGGGVIVHGVDVDPVEQETHEDTQSAGGDGLHNSVRHFDACSVDSDTGDDEAVGSEWKCADAVCACKRDSVGGVGHQRRGLHRNHDFAVELGYTSCTGLKSRCFSYIEPALASYLGVQLLGEHLGPHAWLGGGLIWLRR